MKFVYVFILLLLLYYVISEQECIDQRDLGYKKVCFEYIEVKKYNNLHIVREYIEIFYKKLLNLFNYTISKQQQSL